MQQSESIAQLAAALTKAQAEMEPAIKDADNPFFKSKYADLGEVWRVVQAAFGPQGLSVVQAPETREDGKVSLTTMILHESGEWVAGTMPVLTDKDTPQGAGSGITYARRYALAAMCGVVAEPDDDGEAAMGRNGNGGQQRPAIPAAQGPAQPPGIGEAGMQRMGGHAEKISEAVGRDRKDVWADLLAHVRAGYGKPKVSDLTVEEARECKAWLDGMLEPDVFSDDAAGAGSAGQLGTGSGETQ